MTNLGDEHRRVAQEGFIHYELLFPFHRIEIVAGIHPSIVFQSLIYKSWNREVETGG
jgi:hypothetical protein